LTFGNSVEALASEWNKVSRTAYLLQSPKGLHNKPKVSSNLDDCGQLRPDNRSFSDPAMKFSSSLGHSARDPPPIPLLGLLLASLAPLSHAITFTSVPSANLDLSALGRVGLAGDFDGISLYQFVGQNEDGFSTNGSQSVLSPFPNGGFASLASADAGIQAMCSFVLKNGTMSGVVVGGNFTSLGGVQSPGAAMFNPTTSTVIPLTGLSGQVSALLCDQDTSTVYVGGSFKGANSTNAIAWVGDVGWTNLPFDGFNGPVTTISKASNGHIIFGGSFTGLGNATGPSSPDQQIINISSGNLTTGGSSTTDGFSDPSNIVCKTSGVDGAGNTWLLADNTPGFWDAEFGFGFEPTKLRLWNTHQDGRGTKTWRYTAHPIDGIMNFTYVDPATGQTASCSSECPLSSDTAVKFQDYHFVNVIGMSGFRVDISAWYGDGGGLDGIELFQDDIFSYAVPSFNEPTCANISLASTATSTGEWEVTPSLQSLSEYLTSSSESASVTFLPDIKQSGNYSVNMYTPGCLQDDSCSSRGRVTINGTMSTGATNSFFSQTIFQTNNFDKYDQIYFGFIEAGSASFRPSVTLAPVAGQNIDDLSVVAQRVGFTLISSGGGLDNLFEYDPTQAVIDTSDFTNSIFDKAGVSLGTNSAVTALETSGSTTFVGGNFSTSSFENIFAVSASQATPLTDGGLNGEVTSLFLDDSILYVGGKFTNTSTGGTTGLSNIADYDTSKNTWSALGAGVNGLVNTIVPLQLNVTANTPETVIAVSGNFDQILAFGSNKAVSVTGFAVWIPSQKNWLQNLNTIAMAISGDLTASVNIPGGGTLLAGSLSSSQLFANGVVSLTSTSTLSTLPINIQSTQSQTSLTKRATTQNITGVVTGVFYDNGGRNVTILGGHFTATGTNGSDVNNLAFINGSNSDAVTGVGSSLTSDSTVLALTIQDDTLWAGGSFGMISYNLLTSTFNTQPPALSGDVNSIALQPSSSDVYVAGSFSSAGSLSCPAVCVFSSTLAQWHRPGSTLSGTANTMTWASTDSLIVGGSLTVDGASASLVTYDAKQETWAEAPGASVVPGPVTALATASSDTSEFWVSGTATNGSAFLMRSKNGVWDSVGDVLGSGSTIRGLQMIAVTKSHASSNLISASEILMITGALNLPGFGNASAVVFNGTAFQPFALTTTSSNTGGSLSQFFSQKQATFPTKSKPHKSTSNIETF
jgi:hypothetical protein